jgi:hypothetical protein
VPYSRDIADQRKKYGDNMLRRGDEHLATQKAYEAETQARIEIARRKRQEEKERLDEIEVSPRRFGSTLKCLITYCSEHVLKKRGRKMNDLQKSGG